jgi:AcrR family transcriptional regulator
MEKPTARGRLAEAAFDLFNERGYEQTTVDDIAERAGLGRATFFRHYRSKEDVIFPDHDRLLDQVRERLRSTSHDSALPAVSEAVRLVLLHYLDEGELARRRYALTSTVPALRDREIVSVARYQRLFREYIAGWMADRGESDALKAELMAAAVASAHNHVLRRWLRGDSTDPVREVDAAMRQVISLFTPRAPGPDTDGTTVVAFRTSQPLETVLPAIKQVIETEPQLAAWLDVGYSPVTRAPVQRGTSPSLVAVLAPAKVHNPVALLANPVVLLANRVALLAKQVALPANQLAQLPCATQDRDHDSRGRHQDRGAEQRQPANHVPKQHQNQAGEQRHRHGRHQQYGEQRHGEHRLRRPAHPPGRRVPDRHIVHPSPTQPPIKICRVASGRNTTPAPPERAHT